MLRKDIFGGSQAPDTTDRTNRIIAGTEINGDLTSDTNILLEGEVNGNVAGGGRGQGQSQWRPDGPGNRTGGPNGAAPKRPRQPDPLQTALGFPSTGTGRGPRGPQDPQRRRTGPAGSTNTWAADRFGTGVAPRRRSRG